MTEIPASTGTTIDSVRFILQESTSLPWHRHPLLQAAVAFLLSGVIALLLTRWLQDRSNAMDTKRLLIEDMTKSLHRMILAVQAVEIQYTPSTFDELNKAWQKWKIASAVLRSKLRLYFPNSGIDGAWINLEDRVDEFYGMQEERDPIKRDERVVKSLRKRSLSEQDQRMLERGVNIERVHWMRLKDELLEDLEHVVRSVLAGKSVAAKG
jgi:hypothetical protein